MGTGRKRPSSQDLKPSQRGEPCSQRNMVPQSDGYLVESLESLRARDFHLKYSPLYIHPCKLQRTRGAFFCFSTRKVLFPCCNKKCTSILNFFMRETMPPSSDIAKNGNKKLQMLHAIEVCNACRQ